MGIRLRAREGVAVDRSLHPARVTPVAQHDPMGMLIVLRTTCSIPTFPPLMPVDLTPLVHEPLPDRFAALLEQLAVPEPARGRDDSSMGP